MFHVPKVHLLVGCVLIISVHFANSHPFCLNYEFEFVYVD